MSQCFWYTRGTTNSHSITAMNRTTLSAIILVVLAIISIYFYSVATTPAPGTSDTPPVATSTPTTNERMTVKVAVLDTEQKTSGKQRGCDRVVMLDRQVPKSQMTLTAALKELFSINQNQVDGWYNFIASTNRTLTFEKVTVENGIAKVYLTGSLSGLAGVCDDPRAAIQIEETALQFPTVAKVELYLNNEKTSLVPSERGDE